MLIVNDKDEYANIIFTSKLPILVDFYADWCGPCKQLTPILETLEKKYENNISFLKINVDNEDCNEICSLYKIQSMPTVLFIKNKVEKDELRVTGLNEELITSNIENLIK